MIFFKKHFQSKPIDDNVRFEYPFFKKKNIQNEVARQGYSVQPLLSPDDIVQLKKDFFLLLEKLGEPLPDKHWTSGRVEDTTVRNFARVSIENILPERLKQYFDDSATDFIGGIFVAKKPSSESELSAHQDSSHVDESKFPAAYAWVPLVDTTVHNGAMHILPGSHRWGNRFRSLNVPWLYDGLQPQIFPHLKPIPMKAGEVLFFDSAAIHHSSSNLSTEIRPAINYFIKPKEALFLHHFIDEQTPKEKVEVYNVDIDFFYNCDFMQRPSCPPYTKLADENRIKKISKEKMQNMIFKI
jgi:hypothetical protein